MPGKHKHNEGHRKKEKKKLYQEKLYIKNPEHPTKQDINAMYRKMWIDGKRDQGSD